MQSNAVNEARATLYMLLAAGTFSLFPIVNLFGIRSIDAFTLSILGLIISGLFFMMLVGASRSARTLFRESIKDSRVVGVLCLSGACLLASYISFAYSLHYIAPEITTVLFESHLVILVFAAPLFVKRLTRSKNKLPYVTSVACFGMVVLLGTFEAFRPVSPSVTRADIVNGVILASFSSLAVAANVIFRQIASDRMRDLHTDCGDFDVSVVANTISRIVPLLSVVFLWSSFSVDPYSLTMADWLLLLFFGVVVIGLNNIFFLMAVNASGGSTINALRYSGPVLSLILLWLLGEISEVTYGIAFAYSAVVLTSFFTVTRPKDDPATIALICSSVFITGLLSFFPGTGMSDYFAATVSPLVLFAVIVAFLIDRIKEANYNQRMIRIELVSKLPAKEEFRNFLESIENAAGENLEAVLKVEPLQSDADLREKSLKYLSIRGTRVAFGEWISLIGSATVAIFAAIAYRSEGFLFDVYALLLSTTLVFLIFQIMTEVRFPSAQLPLERARMTQKATPVILSLLVLALQLITLSD